MHASVLARKRRLLLVRGDYGEPDPANWNREKRYFLENVLTVSFDKTKISATDNWAKIIDEEIDTYLNLAPSVETDDWLGMIDDVATMDPIKYEEYCAEILRSGGWLVRLTPASGDQGADVIATRGVKVAVIQCKYYFGSVGNKAVQEVIAAKSYYNASIAAVVTNAPFTRSAKSLAASCNVLLLHHSELADRVRSEVFGDGDVGSETLGPQLEAPE